MAVKIAMGRDFWKRRLRANYDGAKRRNGGQSLNIYVEVAALLDMLDGYDPVPAGIDLQAECDNLCAKLRRI